jgi:quaternary ammonium compound-resistance protein SugE
MPWVLLIVAGLLEVVWAFTMKQSHGFTRLAAAVLIVSGMALMKMATPG